MPFTLPASNRRHFLRGTLATAAASLLPRSSRAVAATSKPDAASWLLFSDSHIAADPALISRGINVSENLAASVKAALAAHSNAVGAFVSGDLALLNGQEGDYRNFGALIQPLRDAGLPVHLMMGNHDHREHFASALSGINAPSPVEHRFAGIVESEHVNWFFLDSLEETNKTPGLVGPEQLAWLEKALDAHKDKPAVIIVHHNILPVNTTPAVDPKAEPVTALVQKAGKGGLQDSGDLLAMLRPRKQAKACIFGHTHAWNIAHDESGIHLINLPPTGYVFKQGMPSGWVHATLRNDGIKLKLSCVDTAHPQHGEEKDLAWRA